MKISVVLNRDWSLKMANRIFGDWENKLIIYGYRKPLGSRTYYSERRGNAKRV